MTDRARVCTVIRDCDVQQPPHGAVYRAAIGGSATEPVFAIVARSNPAQVEPAELRPELDPIIA
jgi:uncharacterized RmlC-like cupin family protein